MSVSPTSRFPGGLPAPSGAAHGRLHAPERRSGRGLVAASLWCGSRAHLRGEPEVAEQWFHHLAGVAHLTVQ
jgi:hypothetical protein